MVGDERLGHADEVFGLGAVEACAVDDVLEFSRYGVGERSGVGVPPKECGCDFVDPFVGALGGEYGCAEELVGVGAVEFDLSVRVEERESSEGVVGNFELLGA